MKWNPKDQVTMFDLLPNSVDSITKVQPKLKFLDLFAGIGGFRLGMEQAGHECVGYVEWDKYARKSYEAMHNTEGEWTAHDITSVTNDDIRLLGTKGIDVICGGFPCQAFSVAGKRGGFAETRGTLFFEIARIAKQIKPRILLLENVKGLLSHDQGRTFGTILNTLDELGYDCEWQVLNSKNFRVPQNRERVFIVGHLRGTGGREVFPIGGENESAIKTIGRINPEGFRQTNEVLDISGISTALRTFQGGGLQPKVLAKGSDISYTIDASYAKGLAPSGLDKGRRTHVIRETADGFHLARTDEKKSTIQGTHVTYPEGASHCLTSAHKPMTVEGLRIRKLTPRECFRLQGFPDSAFDKAQQVNSDSQLYKQAGNSVTVNVIHEIAKRLN